MTMIVCQPNNFITKNKFVKLNIKMHGEIHSKRNNTQVFSYIR